MRHPPRLANLLLELLAPGNEALRGDLEEEFAAGRGRSWYWRQVFAAIELTGALRVRARVLAAAENWVTGLIMLLLVGFYAAFVVNVTDWLLRFEGVRMLARLPNALGPFSVLAPVVTFFLGVLGGRVIAWHYAHRTAAIIVFGAATMLCAIAALKAVELANSSGAFLPEFLSQAAATAAFVIGLIGSIAGAGVRPPHILLGLIGRRPE